MKNKIHRTIEWCHMENSFKTPFSFQSLQYARLDGITVYKQVIRFKSGKCSSIFFASKFPDRYFPTQEKLLDYVNFQMDNEIQDSKVA